ncbi:thioredoxin family protein [Granulicoccus phenolivorans]|uniref:thioredoxin family protein n=1 Tax=Granulicoccus phenolivorans TaxID=266854 RepID=UPI0003FA9B7E|nr:thioredoxin domain-containing protein [Granulicoccus phenolivorans]
MDAAAVDEVTDDTFADLVLGSPLPVLVDYTADWCAPGRQQEPVLAELARAYAGRMRFLRLDTALNPASPADHQVTHLPTIQIYADGALTHTVRGARPKAELIRVIEDHLDPDRPSHVPAKDECDE